MKAHIFILSTGRALAVCEDKGNPSEPCQDGQLPHHGYPGNQTPLLTAAFVGCRPQETKCRFLGVCRRMQNRPLSAHHHELAITLLLDGRAAAGDKASQLLVYISEALHLGFSVLA